MSVSIEGLDALRLRLNGLSASLGETWTAAVQIDGSPRAPYPTVKPRTGPAPAQPTNGDLIDYYRGTPRDPFQLSEADRAAIARDALGRLGDKLLEGGERTLRINNQALCLLIAGAWRRFILARLAAGAFPAPTPEWQLRKARLGLDLRPMNASLQLYRSLARALVTAQRTR